MIITKAHIPRRTVLRGLGATIALPFLDGMIPAFAQTRSTSAASARRLIAIYAGMGANMDLWTPKTEGAGYELSPILKPLAPLHEKVLVLTGLNSEQAANKVGDTGGIHSRSQAAWLTGVRARRTDGPDFQVGTSMDQIAAKEAGQATQLGSLELTLEAGDVVGSCDYAYTCAYTSTLAWSTPRTPLPAEVNPRAVFDRLFGDADSTDAESRLAWVRHRASILDSVTTDLGSLKRKLTPRDQSKVAEFLDAVRDIERRIQKAEEQSSRDLPIIEQPTGIPGTYQTHAELMFDLLLVAFEADLTRVATFTMARELSGRSYPEIGITEGHHPLSHHQNNPDKMAKQAKLNTFQIELVSAFLQKLNKVKDGDGSMLDRTLVLYGSGMSDSNIHMPNNLPILLVGGHGLGVPKARHLKYATGTPVTNLHLTMLEKMGVQIEKFGDSTGNLDLLSL